MPVRVGVVGTSWWADVMHLPSLKSHPRAEVVAICGRHEERTQEIARKYGISQAFSDYREMIARGRLDALVISTPDDLHHPITMAALEAGLHVLCEKPLAMNAAQAREMYETAEAKSVTHMVLFTYRWMPHYTFVYDLIQQGYIGRPYHIRLYFLGGFARGKQYFWRFDEQHANGALGDLGSHMVDMARWYAGDITRVSANLSTFVAREAPDGQAFGAANDMASLELEFESGAQGVVQVGAVSHVAERGFEQGVVLYGEGGTLEVEVHFGGPRGGAVVRGARDGDEAFGMLEVPNTLWGDAESPKFPDLFTRHSLGPRGFIDAILEGGQATPSFYDGLKAQEVIDAALASHRTGRWVRLPGVQAGRARAGRARAGRHTLGERVQ